MRLKNSFRLAAFAAVTILSSTAWAQAPAASAKPVTTTAAAATAPAASAKPATPPTTAPAAAAAPGAAASAGAATTAPATSAPAATTFRVTGATFVLDGAVQYNKTDESENSALAAQKEIPVFSGSIPPGDHTLQIVLRLRGHGYGVFSYLRGYKFQVPSSHTFTITEGKTLKLDVVAWEKGDVTTALEQRPSIRYVENLRAGVTGDSAPAAAPPAKAEAGGSISVGAGAK